MVNKWNIPDWLEQEVKQRDKVCVYCGVAFTDPKVCVRSSKSWEHIINDAKIVTRENIVLCCRGCNASKGQKLLKDWLDTSYCKERNINAETVASIIKQALYD